MGISNKIISYAFFPSFFFHFWSAGGGKRSTLLEVEFLESMDLGRQIFKKNGAQAGSKEKGALGSV